MPENLLERIVFALAAVLLGLLAAAGVGVGVPLALVAVRIIRYLLYGVTSYDPMTLAMAMIMLLGVALLAAWIPARRAARLDPMAALRCE